MAEILNATTSLPEEQAAGTGDRGRVFRRAVQRTRDRIDRISRADLLISLGAIAIMFRVGLALHSVGSNDILTWANFGWSIRTKGIGYVYDTIPLFNHPPLMGWMAALLDGLATRLHLRFEFLFKLPVIAADAWGGVLVFRSWQGSKGRTYAALACCLFCWNPVSIAVSAYHGNTDCLCAMLILASALYVDRGEFFLAGLALGGSINVKLIGLLMVPVVISSIRTRRNAVRLFGGLAIGVIPFLPFLLFHWSTFKAHVIGYRSMPGYWGITQFLGSLRSTARLESVAQGWLKGYVTLGVKLILVAPIVLAVANRVGVIERVLLRSRSPRVSNDDRRRWSSRQMAAIVYSLFLLLTPGFGVQYCVYPVLPLFAASLEDALNYALTGGAYLVLVYFSLWTGTFPLFSDFNPAFPVASEGLGYLAWAALLQATIRLSLHPAKTRPGS